MLGEKSANWSNPFQALGELFRRPPSEQKAPEPIIIPEGKMAAPGDHRINYLDLGNFDLNLSYLPQIELTHAGNCAEYTTLNMAFILDRLGMQINPKVARLLQNLSSQRINTVEKDLVVPLIADASEALGNGFPTTEANMDNLSIKLDHPTEALDTENALLFFATALKREVTRPDPSDFITGAAGGDRVRAWLYARGNSNVEAILIGYQPEGNGVGHQVGMIRVGDLAITIDTLAMLQNGQLNMRSAVGARAWAENLLRSSRSMALSVIPNRR